MNISNQSQSAYQILLEENRPFTVAQLSKKLHVHSSSTYRLLKPLLDIGLIQSDNSYPAHYTAKPKDEALSLFLLYQSDWFNKLFSTIGSSPTQKEMGDIQSSSQLEIRFVQSRDELMNLSIGEVAHATTSVDLLRSGHEIPADLMLVMNESVKRGVVTRMLVQDYSPENAEQIAHWKENGILVRLTPIRHLRLMIYDSKIAYFISYKHSNSERDQGMMVKYPPFATILSTLFNDWWKKGDEIV